MSKVKKTMQIRDALDSGVSSVGRIYRLDPMYLVSLFLSFCYAPDMKFSEDMMCI
jgi:hypothetical protein